MKDFRGIKLEVGDKVAVLPPNYRNMVEGVIEKFTAKQATIVYKPHHHRDDVEKTSRSSECIVFLEKAKHIPESVIQMVKRMKNRIPMVDPKGTLKSLKDIRPKIKPKVDDGQFTGGVEVHRYFYNNQEFQFFFEDGEIIEAYVSWDKE